MPYLIFTTSKRMVKDIFKGHDSHKANDRLENKKTKHIPCHYENYLPLTYVGVKQTSIPIKFLYIPYKSLRNNIFVAHSQ